MKEPIYYRFGKKYIKVSRHQPIYDDAMVSYAGGELVPISECDEDVGGKTPAEVSNDNECDFFNPLDDQSYTGEMF
jgi:hypothetical protein